MSSNKLIAIIVASVIVVAGAGVFLFVTLRDTPEEAARKKAIEKPPAVSNFQVVQVRSVDAQDRPEAQQKADEASKVLTSSLNELYTVSFLRPGQWGRRPSSEGTPGPKPEDQLAGFFNAEARPTVPGNLGALAVAELGPRFIRVDPTKQEAKFSILLEPDLSASSAVVTVLFEGTGTTKDKEEGPVAIVHQGTFLFINEGDAFRIYSYNVELKADTVVQTAGFGPAREGARL